MMVGFPAGFWFELVSLRRELPLDEQIYTIDIWTYLHVGSA